MKKLRTAHLRQLLQYITERDRVGWHFGNKEQFEKRQKDLKEWIENAIKKKET